MKVLIKGRHGYFDYASSKAAYLGNEICLQIFSKRLPTRNLAPVVFQGPKNEIVKLLTELVEKVKAV